MVKHHYIPPFAVRGIALSLLLFSTAAISQGRIDELGRLFTEVDQREKLDAIRRGTYNAADEQKSAISTVTVNGVMIRNDGKHVVWVNGASTLDDNVENGLRVFTGSTDRQTYNVPILVDGDRVSIKPGQSWSEATGDIKDNY